MNRRFLDRYFLLYALGALAALCALAVSCSKAPPTAPTGSTLTLAVNPTNIPTSTGSATAIATLRLPDGIPQPGAQVQFSTTLGSLSPAIATTDNSGNASSRLTGDGRIGTASVTAFSGSVMSSSISVNIGAEAATLALQAVPSSIDTSGGTIKLTATVRDAQGNPVVDSPVNFSTTLGNLQSGGGFVYTSSAGIAHDTLTVTSGDLSNISAASFNVSVSGAGASTAATFAINISRPAKASFTFTANGLSVVFTDTSTNNPTAWIWTFGDPSSPGISQVENPVHTYPSSGTYDVTLTVSNGLTDSTGKLITSQASAAVTVSSTQD